MTKLNITTPVGLAPPPVPDRMDVIPVHTSDRGTFKFCRRKWDWTSPLRRNLRSKVELTGVYFPLWFGSGIHYALEQFYNPLLSRDPVEAFIYWYTLQWKGGLVQEDELRLSADPHPTVSREQASTLLYKVRGLEELHPDPDSDEFEMHRELGIGMMEYYKGYAERNDNFVVLMAEHTFAVPLGFEAIDPRDGRKKEVYAWGTQDAIIQEQEYGRYGILEHKSAISIDESYFYKLEMDEQCTTYLAAGEREAQIHDLEYKDLDFVLYNALAKKFPKEPTLLQNGFPSLSRSTESTTAALFEKLVRDNNMMAWFEVNHKAQDYYRYLLEQGEEIFIKRDPVRRNKAERKHHWERLIDEAKDMLAPDVSLYPSPSGNWLCLKCPFRSPCLAKNDGSDYEAMLEDGYETNWSRA